MASKVAGAGIPLAALSTIAVLGTIAVWGCRPMPGGGTSAAPVAGRVVEITESEIARLSVRTAWEAVRLRVPWLTYALTAEGGPTQVRIQPPRSVNADETPLLVVDGSRVGDIGYLREISAFDIRLIRILDSEAAQPLYSLAAAGGAIVVETKRRP